LPETEHLHDTQDDEVADAAVDDFLVDEEGLIDQAEGVADDDAIDETAADDVQDNASVGPSPPGDDADEADERLESMEGGAASDEASADRNPEDGARPEVANAPFSSKADSGDFGAEAGEPAEGGSFGGGGWGAGPRSRPAPSRAERQERRSRLLSYVNAAPRDGTSTDQGAPGEDLGSLIDLAAIEAVLKYEQRAGRAPVEQPHNNPGFDIVSTGADASARRLIEVKGLEGEWTERGVKLSHVQFATAQAYPAEYWLYVVEHARDLKNQRVSAIANPFSKVVEYWFDHGWKGAIEEVVAATELNLDVGVKLRHAIWGTGTIEKVNRHGIAISLLIDFGDEGRKLIPFNSSLEFLS